MGLLSNFIAGAAGAGGDILQRERESSVRVKESQDIARFNDELATRREHALAELRNQYQIDAENRAVQAKRDNDAYEASPERIAQLTAADLARNQGIIGNRIALAPKAAEATAAEFEAGKGTRKAAQDEKLSFTLDEYRQKTAAELEAEIKKLNDPKYLQGKAREAAAGRDPNSAALHRVQLETAQLALKEKQAEAKMPPAVKELANAYREQLKSKAAAIDKAVADGSITPDGLKSLEMQRDALSRKVEDLYRPYLGDKAPKPGEAADGLDKDLAARIAALSASKGKPAAPAGTPAKPAAAAQPEAPRQPDPPRDQGTRNPYVDAKGRPLPNADTGSGSSAWESTIKPGIVGAAATVNQAGASAMKAYLAEKIARNEPLSPSEQVRAKQFGLTK